MGNTRNTTMPAHGIVQGQDWAEVGWTKPKTYTTSTNTSVTKAAVGMGKKATAAAALLNATEAEALPKVSLALRTRIQQARNAKSWTQAQLAKAVNVTKQLVNDYESGKAIPDGAVLGKLSRALGVSLKEKKSKKGASAA